MRAPTIRPVPTRFLTIAAALALTHGASAQAELSTQTPKTLTVQESAEASAAPDLALLSFEVLRVAETARAALDEANEAMRDVQAELSELGIEARDLQTSQFSIAPQYRQNEGRDEPVRQPEIVAYEVRQGLNVRVRELASVGEILDRAVTLGVNSGGSIQFMIEDDTALENEARTKAIARARKAAEVMADAAGVDLGAIRTISEGGYMRPMPAGAPMMRMEAASDVPVAAGETSVSASVTVTFDIEEATAP